jgi:hypothetical protein
VGLTPGNLGPSSPTKVEKNLNKFAEKIKDNLRKVEVKA